MALTELVKFYRNMVNTSQ